MTLEPTPSEGGRWLGTLRDEARRRVPPAVWTYVESGAREGVTAAEATSGWQAVRFRTRVLRGVAEADLETSLLGESFASPIGVAPTAMQRAVHPQGERAMASGTAAAGCLHVISSNSGTRFEDLGGGPWWLQAYLPPERDQMLPVLEDAVEHGVRAIVLTADTPYPGTKYAVDDADWTGIDISWWRCNFAEPETPTPWKISLSLDDVTWLRERSGVPVVVKGVLRGDDAVRCLDAGAEGVYVSNHGGRQLDRAVSTAQALAEVVAAVEERAEVYVDGGIRTGLDAMAALALGARAVLVGRSAVHALAVDGARGVERLLTELSDELGDAMVLAGCGTPSDTRDLLVGPGPAGR
jgi:4-hydroxymandelate oxidase